MAALLAVTAVVASGCAGTDSATHAPSQDAAQHDAHDASQHDAASDVLDAGRPDRVDAARRDATADSPRIDVCNGHAALCDRAYNDVTFAGTHDSYSTTSEGFGAPDQTFPIARQLEDGIRALHFEVHVYEGDVYACHSLCAIGAKLLVDEMKSIAAFLAGHPGEVVTLLLERSDLLITAEAIAEVMKAAGLDPLMHVQAVGAPWPTLGAMVQKGERVVAFIDNPLPADGGSAVPPWLLPRWKLTWETPWDNEKPTDFGRCAADRGTMGDGVYVVDTYMEDLILETAAHAALVNYDPFLVERLLFCKRATSTLPNLAMVNFYEVSDIFSVVDVLNGFSPAPSVDLNTFPPTAWPSDAGVADAASPG